MERLTKRNSDGSVGTNSFRYYNYDDFQKLATKLAYYEDLEEQGLLLKLLCKVGDIVYRINKGARNPIIALVVTEIRYKALRSGKVAVKLMCSDDVMTKTNGCLVYYLEEIGKKIWLTKAEAEKALEEMEK